MPDKTHVRPDDLDFRAMLPPKEELHRMIDGWLKEDIGRLDITTEYLIPADARAEFVVNTRHDIVVCGIEIAAEVFRYHVPNCAVDVLRRDGTRARKGDTLARVTGPARGLLTAERTALNLVQLLTGIATLTSTYAEKVKGTGATLIDTRKTIPGYRILSKYASCVGGARNHRIRLDDGILIKDNHIAVCGSIKAAIAQAKALTPSLTKIEVECDTLDQVREAAEAGAEVILFDNMDAETMREGVRIVAGRCETEASGGINLDTIRAKAESGVDYISVGRMTQSAPAADIGLDVSITT
jgi:nicotinate-nucleotide pyrophosphorylase (carboxylating)